MTEVLRLSFDPLIDWRLLSAMVGLALCILLFYVIRYGRAWLTRTLAITVALGALANPSLVEEEREPLPSVVALLLDQSDSMSFGSRSELGEAVYSQLLTGLEADPTLEVRTLIVPRETEGTRLISALEGVLADVPRDRIAGSILITDGQIHDLPESASALNELGPVHGLIVGDPSAGDRRITLVEAPNFDIVGNEAQFTLQFDDPNTDSARIIWSVNGGPTKTRRVETGTEITLNLETERRGENIILFETPPGPEELTLVNNRTAATVSGVRDGLRVLLVTGRPNASGRVWRDLLKSDPSVDLVHFTILRPPFKYNATPLEEMALIEFPTEQLFEEKLNEFDLIIFDQYERRGVITLTYLSDVARYVDEGGALLVVAGEGFAGPGSLANTPLAGILPALPTGAIKVGPVQPTRSDIGARHTITEAMTDSNWGKWLRYIEALAETGDVLMVSENGAPLLAVDRVGEGRVAQLLSDQIWLWARNYDGGGPFADLIRRTVHWLMKEPELDERRLQLSISDEKLSIQLRTLANQAPPLSVETPNGDQVQPVWSQIGPGTYQADADLDQLGLYRARAGGLEAVALNGPANPIEYAALEASSERLEPYTTATGGGVYALQDIGQIPTLRRVSRRESRSGRDWLGLREREAFAVRDTTSLPLMPGLVVVGLLSLLLILAWRREGR